MGTLDKLGAFALGFIGFNALLIFTHGLAMQAGANHPDSRIITSWSEMTLGTAHIT